MMDLDLEENWLDSCMESVTGSQHSESPLSVKDIPAHIPEICERDVTNEIEKLTTDEWSKPLIFPLDDKEEEAGEPEETDELPDLEKESELSSIETECKYSSETLREEEMEKQEIEDKNDEHKDEENVTHFKKIENKYEELETNGGSKPNGEGEASDSENEEEEENDTGDEENEKNDTGDEENEKIDTGDEENEKNDTGDEENEKIDTGDEENEKNDTGDEENEKIDTGDEENEKNDTGDEENEKIDTGDEENEKIDTGDEENEKNDTGDEENEKIDTGDEENESGDEHAESGEERESGVEQDSGDESEDHESGDEDNEDDEHGSGEEQDEEDETSSKVSDSSAANSPRYPENQDMESTSGQKVGEDDYCEENPNILEPACELAESDDFEQGYKSRFNLRKRSHIQASNDDFGSDIYYQGFMGSSVDNSVEGKNEILNDCEPEIDVPIKKLKFNFHKKNYRRQRPYTNEAVKEAVKMVHSKKMSILEASRQFDIPRTSLHNFVRLYKRGRRIGVRTISPGLTKQEEEEMVSLVIKLSRCGKRYSHNELRYLIQYYLVNNDRPVFKSGTLPTMGWIAGLVERQPDLIKAKSKKNTKVAAEDVEEWQRQIEDYLVNDWDLDIEEIFKHENGHRIFCFNAFKMTLNGPAENAENKPSPVKKEPGVEEEKDQEMSIILGMSAAGGFIIPTVVLTEDNRDICLDYDSNAVRFLFNKTGRVDEDVALRVVKDFDEEIVEKNIPKPVVFFVNDKQDLAHFSVIEYCWENQIVIICLPPKTCKTMTPFEVSIWPKIRSSYASFWKNAPRNYENKLAMDQFPDLFVKAWESASIPKQAVRGFTKSGLIPLNVPAILGEPTHPEHMDDPPTQLLMQESMEDSIPDELSSMEERNRGKLEGIQMCLEAIESFIPPDIFPIWNERGADYRGRCELAFKLWRSVSLLLKAGCAMASIQQMADGFFNPFGSDFSSTASFFQKTPVANPLVESRCESPKVSTSPSPSEKPVVKKRKLNKSIYSRSEASIMNSANGDMNKKPKPSSDTPFVKVYQNAFMMHEGAAAED